MPLPLLGQLLRILDKKMIKQFFIWLNRLIPIDTLCRLALFEESLIRRFFNKMYLVLKGHRHIALRLNAGNEIININAP